MSALPVGDSSSAAVNKVLSRTAEVAVLPQVVYKIMEMTASTDSAASVLERAIIIDPGFSAKILTQANSAYYALPRKVTSIKEAVAFLGFRAVRQLAMAVGVFDLFVGKTDRESIRRRGWWRHSLDTAVCSRFLSEKFGLGQADEGYTVGLLHLLGKTLLDRSEADAYEKVSLLEERGATTIMAEDAVFGCNHLLVGQAAAERWGFPEVLVKGLDYYNEPEADEAYAKLRGLVAFGHMISEMHVAGRTAEEIGVECIECWPCRLLGVADVESVKAIYAEATEKIASAAQISL